MARLSYTTIKEVCTEFETLEFFTERELIKSTIKTRLSTISENEMGSTIEIVDIQLRKIDVEDEYENAIQDKLIAK